MIKKSAAAIGILALISGISILVENITRPEQTYLAWDQLISAPDTINSVNFKAYIDNSVTGLSLNGVTCIPNGTMFQCKTLIKNLNLTPTLHLIQITSIGIGGESVKSGPIEINFVVVSEKK